MKNNSSKTTTSIIALLVAVVIALLLTLFYVLTQSNSQPATHTEQAQITAADIAQIVKQTLQESEAEVNQAALAGMLEPWAAAQEGDNRVYGNPDARFSIVTFSDLECPFCKRFNDTPKKVVDASNGAVNFEFKHLPLGFHNPAAMDGALMVECVAKHKGNQHAFAFIDQYFKATRTNGAGVTNLDELAKSFGVSSQQVAACKVDREIQQRVDADVAFAAEAGVSGTPSSFVVDTVGGNSIQIGGAQGAEVFINAVRNLIQTNDGKKEEASEQELAEE